MQRGDVVEAADQLSSVFCVGVISLSEALRASASAGASQSCSTISVPSCAAVCAGGRLGDEEARVEALRRGRAASASG